MIKISNNILNGSVVSSPLFRRFLTVIILTMLGFTVAVYFFAVPYIRNLVYSLEEKSIRTNLSNIHKLIEANALSITAYKESVTSAHKRQLKNITLFMETYLKNKYSQARKGIISTDAAKRSALEELRDFRYGNNDYVWVADYKGFYLSHPDPQMNKKDFSKVQDVFGNYVLTPLIQQTMENGEAYNSYWWQRLENDLPAEKLTYAKLFPQWEWVIGTGVYMDDLENEIILRKEKMIDELRQILKNISIGKTGYMYIIDSWNNIIIHPDAELENTDMSLWKNPITGNMLADDLKTASHTQENKVAYPWNRPDDKSNYIYDKIDWVSHVENFDWYIVASVYTSELNTSSVLLRNRILILAFAGIIFSIIIVSLLVRKLLDPLRRLSHTAGLVEAGDLSAQSDVNSKDEIGFLAGAFNSMIAQLRDVIQDLDLKVLQRTTDLNTANEELTSTVGELEQYNWEVTQLNQLAEKLNSCHSLAEMYPVIAKSMSGLFALSSGALYGYFIDNNRSQSLKPVANWGITYSVQEDQLIKCRSIKERKIVVVNMPNDNVSPCEHVQGAQPYISICIPLFSQSETLGMISIISNNMIQELPLRDKEHMLQNWQRLATNAADYIAMALSNMKLNEQLKDLSVRDGLTGLFNRRYMQETLDREFHEAQRSNRPLGIIILDVDFFKQFNDTYGHRTGDLVLVELAKQLENSTRKGDVVCRYGGEEFLIILPGAPADNTINRAEAVREKVDRHLKIILQDEWLPLTISLGVAVFPDHGNSPEEVLKAADEALYRAKKQGRNRVVSA